jgi:flagella basal body P-ring formation protein FlgA
MTLLLFASCTLSLANCVEVGGEYVTAGDLSHAFAAFRALPPQMPVLFSPALGLERRISRRDLSAAARRYGLQIDEETSACFVVGVHRVSRSEVLGAMRRVLADGEIDLMHVVPDQVTYGQFEFSRSGITRIDPARNLYAWKGVVRVSPKRAYPIRAMVRITTSRNQLTAARDVARGTTLTREDLSVARALANPLESKRTLGPEEAAGRVARFDIPKGTLINATHLSAPLVVKAGELVRVAARVGSARITIDAKAERNGAAGDIIMLRNMTSKKRFAARVTGPQQADVDGIR